MKSNFPLTFGDPARVIQSALTKAGLMRDPVAAPAPEAKPRRPLGETIGLLRQGLARRTTVLNQPGTIPGGGLRGRSGQVSVPDGALYLTRTFTGGHGARAYTLYVPSDRTKLSGLVVMLHGCTQDSNDFAIGTGMNAVAEEHGLVVAYPAQPRSANASSCWNWFEPKDQRRGAGEPAILAVLTEALIAEFEIDRSHVFVAGLSAGGAMAAIMATAYPDLYEAAGVHSGLPPNAASDVISAFAAMRGESRRRPVATAPSQDGGPRARFIVFHGDADTTVSPANADSIVAGMTAHLDASWEEILPGRSSGGIAYTRTVVRDQAGIPPLNNGSCTASPMPGQAAMPADPIRITVGPMHRTRWSDSFCNRAGWPLIRRRVFDKILAYIKSIGGIAWRAFDRERNAPANWQDKMENATYVTAGWYLTYVVAGVTALLGLACLIEAVIEGEFKPSTVTASKRAVRRRAPRPRSKSVSSGSSSVAGLGNAHRHGKHAA